MLALNHPGNYGNFPKGAAQKVWILNPLDKFMRQNIRGIGQSPHAVPVTDDPLETIIGLNHRLPQIAVHGQMPLHRPKKKQAIAKEQYHATKLIEPVIGPPDTLQ